MKSLRDKKPVLIAIAAGIFEMVMIYFAFNCYYNSSDFTRLDGITWDNILGRLMNDCIAVLIIPAILIILYRKNLSLFKLRFTGKVEIFSLSAVMILLFFLHNDFTVKGFYHFFFYLIFVGFAEEFIYRGFIYNTLKSDSKGLTLIISCVFWGITHAVLPAVISNKDMVQLLLSMTSDIGFGTVFGMYYIYLMEKSNTLWIPVLIHAIQDYTVGPIGVIAGVGMLIYLPLKSKLKDRAVQTVKN